MGLLSDDSTSLLLSCEFCSIVSLASHITLQSVSHRPPESRQVPWIPLEESDWLRLFAKVQNALAHMDIKDDVLRKLPIFLARTKRYILKLPWGNLFLSLFRHLKSVKPVNRSLATLRTMIPFSSVGLIGGKLVNLARYSS